MRVMSEMSHSGVSSPPCSVLSELTALTPTILGAFTPRISETAHRRFLFCGEPVVKHVLARR